MKFTVKREIEAEQWLGEGHPLPAGCHLCKPEVNWSAGHAHVYFTYAELWPEHWMGVEKHAVRPEGKGGIFEAGYLGVTKKDGAEYFREVLSFRMWKVKSEASATGNRGPVFLDENDEAMLDLFIDYVMLEGHGYGEDDKRAALWKQYPMARAEFRATDGNYGRGYRPIYLKPGDWLVHNPMPHGHNNLGTKDVPVVMSDAEFKAVVWSPESCKEPS